MKASDVFYLSLVILTLAGFCLVDEERVREIYSYLPTDTVRTHCCRPSASASLKTLASAQADFRANDRDGNRVREYWHGDIAGLYVLKGIDGQPIKNIDISIAAADANPVTDIHLLASPGCKAGYYFRALRPPDEADWWEPGQFGACAFPKTYGTRTGRFTFFISQDNTIYKKDLGRTGGIQVLPADPIAEGWTKLD